MGHFTYLIFFIDNQNSTSFNWDQCCHLQPSHWSFPLNSKQLHPCHDPTTILLQWWESINLLFYWTGSLASFLSRKAGEPRRRGRRRNCERVRTTDRLPSSLKRAPKSSFESSETFLQLFHKNTFVTIFPLLWWNVNFSAWWSFQPSNVHSDHFNQ